MKKSRRICIIRGAIEKALSFHLLCLISTVNMMRETLENMPGTKVNGQNVNKLRYADDAMFITDD